MTGHFRSGCSPFPLLPSLHSHIDCPVLTKPAQQSEAHGRPPVALACGFLSLASWMQYYPMADPRHFFWALVPMIGPFAYFLLLTARGRILPVAIALLDSRDAVVRDPDQPGGPACPKSVLDHSRRFGPGGHGRPASRRFSLVCAAGASPTQA